MDLSAVPADAGVVDAGVADAAPPDAAEAAPAGDITIEVTGKKAEIQAAGDPAWKPLDAGAGIFPLGAHLRLGAGTTAKLVSKGTTLELAGGRARPRTIR